MIAQARTARPTIVLNGSDYFSKLAPYFLNLSYTDNCDGQKADDLQLQLADRDRRFINDWMPDKGAYFDVSIICQQWFAPNAATLSLDCGRFWIDTINFELPQHTVSIKASSIPTDAHVKGSEETRGWEGTTLKDIATQIAGESNMSIDWQSKYNPKYDRVEQVTQSGLGFLKERANDAKLSIKIARQQIIIFDEEEYEARPAAFTLLYGNSAGAGGLSIYRMSAGQFTTKLVDTAKKAKVKKLSPDSGELSDESWSAEDSELNEEHSLQINEDVGSASTEASGGDMLRRAIMPRAEGEPLEDWHSGSGDSDAQRKAKAVVRDANKDKERATVELSIGNPLVAAGQTFNLSGIGKLDGKWFIESIHHEVGPMFKSSLGIRKCLKGY